jgi:hypothetical protein
MRQRQTRQLVAQSFTPISGRPTQTCRPALPQAGGLLRNLKSPFENVLKVMPGWDSRLRFKQEISLVIRAFLTLEDDSALRTERFGVPRNPSSVIGSANVF